MNKQSYKTKYSRFGYAALVSELEERLKEMAYEKSAPDGLRGAEIIYDYLKMWLDDVKGKYEHE